MYLLRVCLARLPPLFFVSSSELIRMWRADFSPFFSVLALTAKWPYWYLFSRWVWRKEGDALAQNKFQSKGELNKEIDELHRSSLFLRTSKAVEHFAFFCVPAAWLQTASSFWCVLSSNWSWQDDFLLLNSKGSLIHVCWTSDVRIPQRKCREAQAAPFRSCVNLRYFVSR